jgi:hypothetical protein
VKLVGPITGKPAGGYLYLVLSNTGTSSGQGSHVDNLHRRRRSGQERQAVAVAGARDGYALERGRQRL